MGTGVKFTTIDIETTIYTSFKRKANPFDERNWMVLVGYKHDHDELPTAVRLTPETQGHGWLTHILSRPDLTYLVGVNIKFDLLHALRDPVTYAKWQDFVERGGLVWDCQLAEYLLDGQAQGSHMLSLDELALRYGGDLKVDEVKALWEAGVPTQDIDPDLLKRYLIGETLPNGFRREGDIGNTELVFKAQYDAAVKRGQLRSIELNMGSLCATIEMERNGMFVDKELGLKLAAELEVKLAEARNRLQAHLPADLPFEFNWTNRYHLSPLIFGGSVKYTRRMYYLKDGQRTVYSPEQKPAAAHLFAYTQKDEVQYVLSDGTTTPVTPEDAAFREPLPGAPTYVKFAGGKNAGEYKTKKVKVDDLTKPKAGPVDYVYEFPGHTTPKEEWASSTDGLFSVASDVIDELGVRNIPFLKDLSSVVAMQKDLGTYYITYNEQKGEHVGMLTLVQPDSIIHHGLNHTSTVTGRFSSSNPNLQNIPKGNKSDVKTVFKSRFTKNYMMHWLSANGMADTHAAVNSPGTQALLNGGGYVVQSDFSSLEVYIQALLTHCKNLLDDLRAGIDLHCMRLALKEHMEYGEVFALCKGDKYSEEWDYKRTGAKRFSFQRAYGAGNKKIAESTGMPLEEVEALAAAEDARYPEINAYFDKRAQEIKANRRPTNKSVPHPKNPAVLCQLGISRVSTPDGKKYTYMESPSMPHDLKRGITATFTPTEIKNYEVQGEGGEWMKAAMWLGVRAFYKLRNFNNLALLVNTVHDAQYADAHASVKDEVGALLQACMEAASDFMEYWFNWPLDIPVPTDTVYGASMAEETPFGKGEGAAAFRTRSAELRAQLRRSYMGDYQPSYLKGTA